jgi:hypothetical protein
LRMNGGEEEEQEEWENGRGEVEEGTVIRWGKKLCMKLPSSGGGGGGVGGVGGSMASYVATC